MHSIKFTYVFSDTIFLIAVQSLVGIYSALKPFADCFKKGMSYLS